MNEQDKFNWNTISVKISWSSCMSHWNTINTHLRSLISLTIQAIPQRPSYLVSCGPRSSTPQYWKYIQNTITSTENKKIHGNSILLKMSTRVIEYSNSSLLDRQIKIGFRFYKKKTKFCSQNLKIRWQNRGMAVRQVHGFPYVWVVTLSASRTPILQQSQSRKALRELDDNEYATC